MRILLHIATFVGIMATLFLIQWYAARARAGDESKSVFIYSWPAKLFGIVTVSILPFVILDIAQNSYLRIVLFALEAVLIGYVVALLTTRFVLRFDSVEVSSVFRTDAVQYSNISEIGVSESAQCYFLGRKGTKPFKISFYVLGVKALIAAIEQRSGVKCEYPAG